MSQEPQPSADDIVIEVAPDSPRAAFWQSLNGTRHATVDDALAAMLAIQQAAKEQPQ